MVFSLWNAWQDWRQGLRGLSRSRLQPKKRLNRRCRLQVEELERRELMTSTVALGTTLLTVGNNVDTGHLNDDLTETSIAIDPLNSKDIFVASNDDTVPQGMYGSFSTDGGQTWHARLVGNGTDGLPPGFSDPWLSWDNFGNLFFTYIDINGNLAINLSTDGGQSFTNLDDFAISDHPEVTTGEGMVWTTYQDLTNGISATGAAVTGLGAVGPFTTLTVPTTAGTFANLGDVAISPTGEVMVAWQIFDGSSNTTTPINVAVDPTGLTGVFGPPITVTTSNVRLDFPPVQPARGITANITLSWDRSGGAHNNRVYLSYTNAPSTTSNSTNVFLVHSDDNGATWSAPVKVNDGTNGNTTFFPHVVVDQITGNVALDWYDCRNDPTNQSAEVFATISTDGGTTFLPNVQVAAGPSNAVNDGDNGGNDFGDYIGIAFNDGAFFPCWSDNSAALVGNTNPPHFDIAIAKITVSGQPVEIFFPLRYFFSAGNQLYNGFLTLYNNTNQTLTGPITFLFPQLPAGVVLFNPTGYTASGIPYIQEPNSLAAQNNLRLLIELENPDLQFLSTYFIGFPIEIVSGPFNPASF